MKKGVKVDFAQLFLKVDFRVLLHFFLKVDSISMLSNLLAGVRASAEKPIL